MIKRLPLLLGVVVIAAVILVARFEKNYDTSSDGYDVQCVQPSQPSSAPASLTCTIRPNEKTGQGRPGPPWWHKLLAWPEGITAWLLLLTLAAILWQSYATSESAKAAFLQIRMTKDKERARVEIKAVGLELTRAGEDFWHIKASVELRNVGEGRAYVRLGTGDLVMDVDGAVAEEPRCNPLNIVDGVIDPNVDPVTESFYFFQPEDAALSEYAQKICDGAIAPHITGFIEYETVGTRFHRNFNYAWVGHRNPLNIGAHLNLTDEFTPKSDEDRISYGFWSQNYRWMTGKSGNNDEYEMETPKEPKKPRKPI